MPTATRDEYLELGGIPLATGAWETTDLSDLYDAPEIRARTATVGYRPGVAAYRPIYGSKRLLLPIEFFGDQDSDGNPIADSRAGLQANLDEFKASVIRPLQTDLSGTRLLRHHLPDGTIRSAPAQIRDRLKVSGHGPGGLSGVLDIEIPGGVLNSETEVDETSSTISTPTVIQIPNPGTADQFAVLIDLTGTATSVVIYNETWNGDDELWLQFGGDMEDSAVGTQIDTDAFTAVRNSINVVGLVTSSGHEFWMPLLADGDNDLRVEPTGGNVVVRVRHYPAYA